MSSYIYDGALSPRTLDSIRSMMREYPNPVELSAFRRPDFLPEHRSTGEDCMGREYAKSTQLWGLVHKNFDDQAAGCFLFLCSVAEKQMVLDRFADLVVNAEPFRSVL